MVNQSSLTKHNGDTVVSGRHFYSSRVWILLWITIFKFHFMMLWNKIKTDRRVYRCLCRPFKINTPELATSSGYSVHLCRDEAKKLDGSSSHTQREHQVYEHISALRTEFDTLKKGKQFATWIAFGVNVALRRAWQICSKALQNANYTPERLIHRFFFFNMHFYSSCDLHSNVN